MDRVSIALFLLDGEDCLVAQDLQIIEMTSGYFLEAADFSFDIKHTDGFIVDNDRQQDDKDLR